ncbi:hypothetical protein [Ruminococcus sp.]|uniref:hypothetical protein n=1 Tax=Ruminococcus sp. TaxID=41978 RepID=UPI00258EA242|nr:hypothetical protein [Ruminococcus sp.]MCR5021784.1 hypothetical protein [Ruminococcus sp.]
MKDSTYFDSITPCGENCTGCKNKQNGRCRIFACATEHGAVFFGVRKVSVR